MKKSATKVKAKQAATNRCVIFNVFAIVIFIKDDFNIVLQREVRQAA